MRPYIVAQYVALYCGPVCGPDILALYFGPVCGPIFWPRMRSYIVAPYAALYFVPVCVPILWPRMWPYIVTPYAALYCIVESILTSKREMSEKKGNE